MIVLGIDPGTANTGYGVVLSHGGRLAALDGGVIDTRAGVPLERRLAQIHARVCDLIREHEPATYRQIAERFRNDDPQVVTGVLNDLTSSGLCYRSGRAQDAVYRIAAAADFAAQDDERRGEAEEYMVWLAAYRRGPSSVQELAEALSLPAEACQRALKRLLAEGRVREQLGKLGHGLPFAELERRAWVNERAHAADGDPAFSQRIREAGR